MSTIEDLRGRLWSDEPSKVDFLAARAIAETVSDAVLDDALDPLAIGLSGPWGSGKTTVLELIKADLDSRSDPENAKIITVRTDPWRYDPAVGAKESLIGEVLDAIAAELTERLKDVEESKGEKIKKLLKRLSDRVDWAKAVKLAAKSSLTLQIPGVNDVLDLIREPASEGTDAGDQPRGLDYDALRANPNIFDVAHQIAQKVCEDLPAGTIETAEQMEVVGRLAEWLVESDSTGTDVSLGQIAEEAVALILAEAYLVETASSLNTKDMSGAERAAFEDGIRQAGEELAEHADLSPSGPSAEEFTRAIEYGLEYLRTIHEAD